MSKTHELIQKLQDGIRDLFNSGRYADYLQFLSAFHNYSAGNCLLIWSQMPEATLVASYSDWNNKHHRQVKKGAKGIKILCPHTYRENDEKGEQRERISFHCGTCFDVSQTYAICGEDIPQLCRSLDYDVVGFRALLRIFMQQISPVPVQFENIPGNTRGYFSPTECRISIKEGMSEADTLKTLIHEIAHAMLHAKGAEEEKTDRRTKEVEAESIAYVVSQHLNIDTSDYSFGYVAGWSSDKSVPELRISIEVIRKTSDIIIGLIEEATTNEQYEWAPEIA